MVKTLEIDSESASVVWTWRLRRRERERETNRTQLTEWPIRLLTESLGSDEREPETASFGISPSEARMVKSLQQQGQGLGADVTQLVEQLERHCLASDGSLVSKSAHFDLQLVRASIARSFSCSLVFGFRENMLCFGRKNELSLILIRFLFQISRLVWF